MEIINWIVSNDYLSLRLSPELIAALWLIWKQHVRLTKLEDSIRITDQVLLSLSQEMRDNRNNSRQAVEEVLELKGRMNAR